MNKWRNFKTDPPYDAYEDEQNGMETDYVRAYFIYRYTGKPHLGKHIRLSYEACTFSNNIFEGYESHMKTSPYPEDWIEVLYWIEAQDVKKILLTFFEQEHK